MTITSYPQPTSRLSPSLQHYNRQELAKFLILLDGSPVDEWGHPVMVSGPVRYVIWNVLWQLGYSTGMFQALLDCHSLRCQVRQANDAAIAKYEMLTS